MKRHQESGLSHHEELRYFYLLRHFQYLSDNEKREFAFLKTKKDRYDQALSPYTNEPVADYNRPYPEQDFFSSDDGRVIPKGVPAYPTSEMRSRRHKKRKASNHRASQTYATEDFGVPPQGHTRKHPKKGRLKRFMLLLILLVLLLILGIGAMFAKGVMDVSSNKAHYKPAASQVFHGEGTADGTNILILGSDKRVTQGSTDARTDTIMVVNVGNKDNHIKMVSFMRDTLVNIPGYSYDNNSSYDLKLNASFTLGEQEDHQGAEFVRKTLKHNYDIDCKYYVMVDFETFAEAIDTLFPNGVNIDAKFATVNGEAVDSVEVPDDLRMKDGQVPNQLIEVGEQRMDGRTLLNYARFRKDDEGDYGRTVRQQQVMSEIIRQIKDPTKLFTGSAAIGKIYALTSTNVSFPFVIKNGVKALTSGKKGVEHVTIPEIGDWVDEYDMYGGLALHIDFDKYQRSLAQMGLR
ncbi:LCP family protein [Streptococcus phocae]|uniref:Regulatory protein MsrR n=1 Tax=Streptococcus phocae TaxID=119224 RepID=A0A0P6S8C2_9STRE|nr:LCP family protein [Streptococcus phocae]KPJ22710.1 LytR family transcriptional regulator [Streptococcus phocae]